MFGLVLHRVLPSNPKDKIWLIFLARLLRNILFRIFCHISGWSSATYLGDLLPHIWWIFCHISGGNENNAKPGQLCWAGAGPELGNKEMWLVQEIFGPKDIVKLQSKSKTQTWSWLCFLCVKFFGGSKFCWGLHFLGVKIFGGQNFLGVNIFWGKNWIEDFHQIFNSKLN